MQDEWTDRLSEYLDGELSDEERYAVESHLAGCARCAAILRELTEVVERARTIGPRPPQADLWSGIAARIAPPSRWRASAQAPEHTAPFRAREARLFAFTLPQLAAAAVILVAVSAGVAWQLHPSGRPEGLRYDRSSAGRQARPDGAGGGADLQVRPDGAAGGADLQVHLDPVSLADAQYDAAVADLERALAKGRARLDKATISIVEENLRIIDQAIGQAREALTSDPANSYLSGHLVEARRKKLDLLRRATALTSETD